MKALKALKAFIKPFQALQRADSLAGFYVRATLALNGLNINAFIL